MKKNKGFTLIEILLATSILVMVGVAAIGVERNFMGSASTNKHKLQATALAQEGINTMRVIFNNHLLDSNNPALQSRTIVDTITQNNITFTRTITVTVP